MLAHSVATKWQTVGENHLNQESCRDESCYHTRTTHHSSLRDSLLTQYSPTVCRVAATLWANMRSS